MEIFEGHGLKNMREDFYKLAQRQPAFPIVAPVSRDLQDLLIAGGLKKREIFAAMAMQGLLSNLAGIRREGFKDHEIEEFAVMRADALLAELEKEPRDEKEGE